MDDLGDQLGDTVEFHAVGSLRRAASPARDTELATMAQDTAVRAVKSRKAG